MKKIILLLIISFIFMFLLGCSNNNDNSIDTPEKAVNEIISCYNDGDFNCMWLRVLPKDKYAVSQNLIKNINNSDLFILMGYALNKDNITSDNITSEEYLYGSFKVILGDREMKLENIEQIDNTTYSASIKVGEKTAVMPLKLANNKWYMQIK